MKNCTPAESSLASKPPKGGSAAVREGSRFAGRSLPAAFVLAAIMVLGPACAPKVAETGSGTGGVGSPSGGAAGGVAATGGGGVAGSANGGSGPAGGAGGLAAGCEPSVTPLRQTGTTLELPIDVVFDGKPFVFGETNVVSATANVLPLNMRFFLSAIELLTAGGGSVPVDIVTATGAMQPYGAFFYNAEDPAMQTLRVRAPAGTYTGLKIEFGLSAACNNGFAAGRTYPLSSDSQMSWPHVAGYLFLRYESQVATSDETARASVPPAVHLGADLNNLSLPGALVFRLAGSLSIPATGGPVTKRLRLAMDQVFKGATSSVDVSDLPFPFSMLPEVVAGERLRRTGAELPLFVLGP